MSIFTDDKALAVAVADDYRRRAEEAKIRAKAATEAAERVEREAGIAPPCFLCGHRSCGH